MGPRVLVVDNYDSFVYNLVQELGELGAEPVVLPQRRHRRGRHPGRAARCRAISPGPGRPEDGGVSLEAIAQLGRRDPAARRVPGPPVHRPGLRRRDRAAPHLDARQDLGDPPRRAGLFAGLPNPFVATRYHSLVVRPGSVPDELEVTATSTDGVVMGLRHRSLAVEGVQFHPESVLTASGPALLGNFLAPAGGASARAEPWHDRQLRAGGDRRRASRGRVGRVGRRRCRGGRRAVVVVVVAGWQTEMFTVVPLATCALDPGF